MQSFDDPTLLLQNGEGCAKLHKLPKFFQEIKLCTREQEHPWLLRCNMSKFKHRPSGGAK